MIWGCMLLPQRSETPFPHVVQTCPHEQGVRDLASSSYLLLHESHDLRIFRHFSSFHYLYIMFLKNDNLPTPHTQVLIPHLLQPSEPSSHTLKTNHHYFVCLLKLNFLGCCEKESKGKGDKSLGVPPVPLFFPTKC